MCVVCGATSDDAGRPSRADRGGVRMNSNAGRLAVAAVAIGALIGFARPAYAITHPVDMLMHGFQALRASVRSGVASLFGGPQPETVTPPTAGDVVAEMTGAHNSQFVEYLKDAGYDLSAWDVSLGIIPETKFTFQLVRELSEADRDWLQQELETDAMKRRALVAKIQRRFVLTLLAASEFHDLLVGKVVVGILPLPYLEAEVQPSKAPLSEEHDIIYRELIKQQQKRSGKTSESGGNR